MIEPSRRHGHFDPRFSIQRATAEHTRANGTRGIDELPDGLDWAEFSDRLFPGRRRHDFEALKAYEAYKNGSFRPTDEPVAAVLVGAR
jgi:hypothetical protein